jgi:hypothetical protein
MITQAERLHGETEAFRRMLDAFGANLRVAAPGIIQSFDADKQTVTVQLAIREKVLTTKRNSNDIETDRFYDDIKIPFLLDVPVSMLRAGGFVLTMPITAGDECLVVFGDSCMDAWFQNGDVQNQFERRRHDLSDGYAIVGIWSQPNKITGYSTTSAVLRNSDDSVHVEVQSDTVNVKAPIVNLQSATVNLSDAATVRKLIDERLVDVFNSHVHATAATGPPSTPTTPMILANVGTAKTKAG